MANAVYNVFKAGLLKGDYDLDTGGDDINVMLVTSTYTPNIDSHVDFGDITNEVSGDGYTADGQTLAGQAVTQDNTDDEGVFDANNVTWANSTITARGAVLYKYIDDGGSADDTSPLICYFDFGTDQESSTGDFTISWNAEGIINLG